MAVPARDENAAYLSSGTWSLLGVENAAPVTTPVSTNSRRVIGLTADLYFLMAMFIPSPRQICKLFHQQRTKSTFLYNKD